MPQADQHHPEEHAPLPFLYAVGYWYARLKRGMTLGTRVVAINASGEVFLVKHSYTKGWHLPGGGVEGGETFEEAMRRELVEEANITLQAPAIFHGICLNRKLSRRDHVAVYIAREFSQSAPRKPDWEIIESGFFPVDALPQGTTRGTVARIREVIDGRPCDQYW
ncbi:MAG: NUDIX domain-containing protein [Beijerinckiaceae bacterium]